MIQTLANASCRSTHVQRKQYDHVRLTPYSACSASFFSRNSISEQYFSASFSQVSDQRTGPINLNSTHPVDATKENMPKELSHDDERSLLLIESLNEKKKQCKELEESISTLTP